MPVERFRYDLLFRWFVARSMSEEARRVAGEAAGSDVERASCGGRNDWWRPGRVRRASSRNRTNVKSRRGKNGKLDFRNRQRRNETHESRRIRRCSCAVKEVPDGRGEVRYLEHVLGENRHGLVVSVRVTPHEMQSAGGRARRVGGRGGTKATG